MTRKRAEGSKTWQGVFVLLLTTSMVKSQTTPPLPTQGVINTDLPSGNSTELRKADKAVESVPLSALNNDGERSEAPFYSTTTAPIERAAINTQKLSSGEEKYLQTNTEPIKTLKSYKTDLSKSEKVLGALKHHKQSISATHSIIDNIELEELPIKDYEDLDYDKNEPRQDSTISLINDTMVNFKGIKEEEGDDVVIVKNPKLVFNSTNIIARYIEDSRDLKGQGELGNLTLPKIMKTEQESSKRLETVNQTTNGPIVYEERHDKFNQASETLEKIKNSTEKVESSTAKGVNSLTPKARTISFGEFNEFIEEKNTAKESVSYTKMEKPYPYLRNNISEFKTTDEIPVLENIIVRKEEHAKTVVTERSVVIDNSIQQIKPNHYKRSGNASRVTPTNITQSPVSLTMNSSSETLISTTKLDLAIKENFNDVPGKLADATEAKSTADLSENGLTEAPENKTTQQGLIPSFIPSTESGSKNETNGTINVPAGREESEITVSLFNVTELSTELPSTLQTFSSPLSHSTFSSPAFDISVTTSASPPTIFSSSLPISSSTLTSKSTTSSVGRAIDLTTMSSVEYEFVGLTETTDNYTVINNTVTTTEENDLSSKSTVVSYSEFTTSIPEDTTRLQENLGTTTEREENVTADSSTIDDFMPTDEILEVVNTSTIDSIVETTTLIDEATTESVFIATVIDTDPVEPTTSSESTSTTHPPISSTVSSTSPTTNVELEASTSPTEVTNVDETPTTVSVIHGLPDLAPNIPEDVTVIVKIIVEASWADICTHSPALQQFLADLLTVGMEKIVLVRQIIFQQNPCIGRASKNPATQELSMSTLLIYVVDENGYFDSTMTRILPSLYNVSPVKFNLPIRSFQLLQDADSGNTIAVIVVSSVAFICLILLASLLFIMRKRQTRFNYGERCRPVSLDAYSLDSVSAYNSVRRKGATRASKRSYGNPTFEDSSVIPSHPLNFAGLSTFCNHVSKISEEFISIPQVTARIDELPPGAEIKNRYANVVPLPESRVSLTRINDDPLTEYINASYVRGPKNATKYYIACQGPIESTVTDFWRMIWEQQTKVIIMLTDLIENGVEKCAEYIPPSEVTDCHRLYGDFQVTLKKRETKEKYAISTLHVKNLQNSTYREISHIWYLWPANGVQTDAAGLIAILLEARALQRGGPGPIVVHCSPGTGRTGTLIALDLGIRQYEITRTVDIPRVVYTIRRDRAGAVQTKEQYAFIYKALNLYATKLAGGGLEST